MRLTTLLASSLSSQTSATKKIHSENFVAIRRQLFFRISRRRSNVRHKFGDFRICEPDRAQNLVNSSEYDQLSTAKF